MNKVESIRNEAQTFCKAQASELVEWFAALTNSVKIISQNPSKATTPKLIPQKDSDMSRGGTVLWGRIHTHNPRPRTTGVGPATINFVINPTLQVSVVDFVEKSAFNEGFYSLKKGLQDETKVQN